MPRCKDRTGTYMYNPGYRGTNKSGTYENTGSYFSSSFSFDKHIDIICSRARQAQHAIRVLASHGLRGQRLHNVVRSTLVAGLIYSSPSWWGFAGAADRVRLQAVLTRIGR